MRMEHSVTTVSWIPSEAVTGMPRSVFDLFKVAHYDDPPPDVIDDLDTMAQSDAFRFANRLEAWIDVEDGKVTTAGYAPRSGVVMGSTTVRLGIKDATFAAGVMPEIRRDPEVTETSATFTQTVGGRTGLPAPRHVNHPPFVQFRAPLVWTTLSLTLHADGRADFKLEGASTFPRHWLYDAEGKLSAKAGLADFKEWYRHAFGKHSPWGDEDSPALVTAVETALEREMASTIMRGGEKPSIRKVKEGHLVCQQGQLGNELYLLLDGVVSLEIDGEPLAELGPGAILGERAVLEGGRRTGTLKALTPVRLAVATAEQVDRDALIAISAGHRREDDRTT
jgi:cyclic nucleotide-binding protein